jgi:hypothetical protein
LRLTEPSNPFYGSELLQRFTGERAMLRQLEAVPTVCREIGSTAWRDRALTPVISM